MHTLTPFFDGILAASARASLLTGVVLIIQAALRHRLPARWRHALWLPVFIVLLVPVFPESTWSISSITHLSPVPLPVPELPIIGQNTVSPTHTSPTTPSESSAPIPWRHIMLLMWLAGAAGMLLFGLIAYAQTLWRCRRSRLPVSDALQRDLTFLSRGLGLRHTPRVWMASAIRSPAVTGLLRPTLLLPAHFEQTLTPHEARLVLKHELTHLKRGDLPLNALLCLLLALHWFNPLLWLAFFRARLDREAACDAQVLTREDQSQRVAYGHTLLKVETAFGHHGLSLGFVGIFQHGAALHARIRFIASPPRQHFLMKIALALGIVLLTFLGITKAATPAPKKPHIYITSKFVEITERNPRNSADAPMPDPQLPGHLSKLSDPQFRVLLRTLSQRKGVDLMSPPSVTTRSGQKATIEVVREIVDPNKAEGVKPATANPEVGVSLALLPNVTADDQIALDLSPQVVEFEGFEKPKADAEEPNFARRVLHPDGTSTETVNDVGEGKVRESTFDSHGGLLSKRIAPSTKVVENAYAKPIFKRRQTNANVVLACGQTIVLEMESRTDKQVVEETDEEDRVISSKVEVFHRRLFVFVTVMLIEPIENPAR